MDTEKKDPAATEEKEPLTIDDIKRVASGVSDDAYDVADTAERRIIEKASDDAAKAEEDALKQSYAAESAPYREWLDAHPAENPEMRRKREKREKSRRIIAAVGDGLSAIGNLLTVNQYAPSMYRHERGLSAREKARAEKAKAERDATEAQRLRYSLDLAHLQGAEGRGLAALRRQEAERRALRWERRRKEAKQREDVKLALEKRRKAAADADIAETEAANRDGLLKKKGAVYDSQKEKNDRWQPSSGRKGGGGGGRGGSGYKYTTTDYTRDKDGKVKSKVVTKSNTPPKKEPVPSAKKKTGLAGKWK